MNYYNYYPFYYYREGGPMVGPMPPVPPTTGGAAPIPPAPEAMPSAPGAMPPGPPPPTNPELTKRPETPPQNKAQQDILNRSKELDQKINAQTQPQPQSTVPQNPPQTNQGVPPVPPSQPFLPSQPVAPAPMPTQTPPPPSANQTPAMSESLLNYIPSKRQMRRMTREELLVLRKFLKSHVLKEAMENRGIENIKKFAKDSISKVTNIPDLINTFYPEFMVVAGQCRFAGCVHVGEPDCAVKEAVREGLIERKRYDNYRILYDELRGMRPVYEKRAKKP